MNRLVLICLFLLSAVPLSALEWQTDLETAKQKAAAENKTIVLVFQGSDWCGPCIRLDREIWSSEEFGAYAAAHFVMLKADFPRKSRNALSAEQQEHNKQLAEKYNKNGHFPFVVVLDQLGRVLKTAGYKSVSPQEYIELLESYKSAGDSPDDVEAGEKSGANIQPYKRTLKLMGCHFEVTVVAPDSAQANEYIDMAVAEISRIEKMISSWDPESQTSAINNNAGVAPVKVDTELLNLIERAINISRLTDGAFDISYASMDRIWKFDGSMTEMPTDEAIKASVAKVGFQNIELNKEESTVFLTQEGMKIGFGAIGKGYAADKAKALLMSHGVVSGIINASGDMNTWGKQPNGEDWKVAIVNPLNKNTNYALLPIRDGAVVTSGNYEKYVEFNGTRYSHIINPRTGWPATGLISVTVFAPSAELADALATSVFVMGKDAGLDRVNQMPKVECLVIDDRGNIFTSTNIDIDKI